METIRRLSAILMADVVGYSRLMGQDEERTVATLAGHRGVFLSYIPKFHGRVVDATGDALMAEFGAVTDAVACAVEIQREIAERNEELPEPRRMRFRIGINLGEVIVQGEEVYGDGVNIAARLESLADPGGICISRAAHDQALGKLPLKYEYLGEQTVKNIDHPVRVYRVLSVPGAAAHRVAGAKRALALSWKKAGLALAAVLVIAGVGLGLYIARSSKEATDAATATGGLPLPSGPSIAVLPFTNLSGDPAQEYFSDGITETIITDLSRLRDLLVIASNSVFTYKGKPVDVRKVSRELGVHHVLEGSVQKVGDRVRITAQLIDAVTADHVWAGRWDRPVKDIFALQDEITRNIVTELDVKLVEGEQSRLWRKSTLNPEAYDTWLMARHAFFRFTAADNAKARQLCEHALELDPKFTSAMVVLGWTYALDGDFGWSGESQAELYEKGISWARRAIAIDESEGLAYFLLGDLIKDSGQGLELGLDLMEKGVALTPNYADGVHVFGWHQALGGRAEQGLENIKKGFRLNPNPPGYYWAGLGDAYLWTGQYEEAVTAHREALRRVPYGIWSEISLTIALSQLRRLDEARAQAEELRRAYPNFSLDQLPYAMSPEQLETLKTHLRRAGLN